MASVTKRFFTMIGTVTLEHVKQRNKDGPQWVQNIEKSAKAQEAANPRFKKLRLKGALAHKSHKDKEETQLVISGQLLDENESRIASIHFREDGTSKPSK